jgi:hypothetical protein
MSLMNAAREVSDRFTAQHGFEPRGRSARTFSGLSKRDRRVHIVDVLEVGHEHTRSS